MYQGLIDAVMNTGIRPACDVPQVADGRVRRFAVEGDKACAKSGWIVLFDNGDGTTGGKFGDYKHAITGTWYSGAPLREMTAVQRRAYAQKIADDRRRLAETEADRHRRAAYKAQQLWEKSRPAAADHPYLTRKRIKPHSLRQLDTSLVIAIRHNTGSITSLQFINATGDKRFLSGGQIAGCYTSIGHHPNPNDPLLIAEGFATAASLHEATGYPCAIAFNAVNLKPVALTLRHKYPKAQIILCADADDV
ncbi:MAG: hypothetical protein C0622_07660, partial [Desulfuromonas sp.]